MTASNELLRDKGIVTICSVIKREDIKSIAEDILYINSMKDPPKQIQIILNSPGGNCPDGFMVIDIIEYSKLPVFITGLGICASMGIMILCSGQKGKRVITKNTSLLSHQYSWINSGKFHELVAAQKEQKLEYERLVKHYLRHTNMKRSDIEKYLLPKSDVWLTPQEAKKYGLVDKIIN